MHSDIVKHARVPPGSTGANGFTLVEVLVALLVLSIGLLGVGKMMLFTARSNDSAYQRSQATALGYSILDSMRANRQSALNTKYQITDSNTATDPGVSCSSAAPCTTDTLAQYDLWEWRNRLTAALGPTAKGKVTMASVADPATGATNVTATVTVMWDDSVALTSFGGAIGNAQVMLGTVL